MSFDPDKEYTLEEQRQLDLSELFADGIRDDAGRMRPELQGVGSVAAAIQAQDEGVPIDVLGRMVTTGFENDLAETRTHPEDLLEELDPYPRFAALIASGLKACRDDDDYEVFMRWLQNVRGLIVLRSTGRPG